MKIERLSRKRFEEKFTGGEGAGVERYQGTESVVYLPGRASTKEILHEIYHATHSPDLALIDKGKKYYSAREQVREEIRADEFARVATEKDLYLPLERAWGIARGLLEDGYKPSAIMGAIQRGLEEEGYERLDRESTSELWWLIRETYGTLRSRR